MARVGKQKKDEERRALEAARSAGGIIPGGEVKDFEKPDWKLITPTGVVGVEITELMPPATNKRFSSVLKESAFHEKVVGIAEKEYYCGAGALPVRVEAHFWGPDGRELDKRAMAADLVDFVRTHQQQANPTATFSRRDGLPEGFGTIGISTPGRAWLATESNFPTESQIYEQIDAIIRAKSKLLPTYRANLPNSPIWLLIYSCSDVAGSVPMWHDIDKRPFRSEFDRTFFFSMLSNRIVEICDKK